ncbi:D-aminoacylase [Sandaracinobacter neustonicus]|uniref:D-aminoacylase n=1 Tax=Sandaracinobacter neustonicus TaxID=1715348 RepID=A0A501XHF4_9SPHN|nr:D-aminoacylase [Sandaracinobacter neustonicus]TPE60042.1 D-aminoacylase [Sandaracinobacter neustonicus]
MRAIFLLATVLAATPAMAAHDLVIQNGMVFDGTGAPGFKGWVAIDGDRIAATGKGKAPAAKRTVDAKGQAIAPGFVNMLSWATQSLLVDGRGMSDLKQGVTLEVMGEGWTMGPLTPAMRDEMIRSQSTLKFDVPWTTLGEYLTHLETKGVSPNVASYVGATTVRIHELGADDVDPTPEQLVRMQKLVTQAMNEGAMGVGSSLIYAPASYAETPELIALMKAAGKCGGSYISHMRSEGPGIEAAIDELITIARESGAPAEIYHLKISGKDNWGKADAILKQIADAKAQGLDIRADMYLYEAGATGLDASMPTWVQAGGDEAWVKRLKDPEIRKRVLAEMRAPAVGWESLYQQAGDASKLLLVDFRNPKLRHLVGKTLAEVAAMRGTSPEDTIIDLVIEDESRVGTAYFMISPKNVERFAGLPWVTIGSDAGAPAIEGVFLENSDHPRAYGNVARFLGYYVRDRKVDTLESAIHRLSGLPAKQLKISDRGTLKPGMFADVVVFDPATIQDHATFQKPKQYSTGVNHVWVNGVQVLKDGEHTGAKPGRFVKGPGFGKCV